MIRVRPRYVARPWERELYEYRTVMVGRETDVRPEPGALEEYLATWPERYVVWNVERQLFEVRQHNPVTFQDERVELVYEYEEPPAEILEARSREVVRSWRTIGRAHGWAEDELPEEAEWRELVPREWVMEKVWRPFDMRIVLQRRRERMEFYGMGARRYSDRIVERNEALARSRIRDFAREAAAAIGEVRRYIPTVGGEPKIPLVAVGVDLKGGK